jgi:hypothetical protein
MMGTEKVATLYTVRVYELFTGVGHELQGCVTCELCCKRSCEHMNRRFPRKKRLVALFA